MMSEFDAWGNRQVLTVLIVRGASAVLGICTGTVARTTSSTCPRGRAEGFLVARQCVNIYASRLLSVAERMRLLYGCRQ